MRAMIFVFAMVAAMGSASAAPYDVVEKNMTTLQSDLASGRVTSEQLVKAYTARIEKIDRSGPTLRSVLALNPNALADARASDARRKAKQTKGPLDGLPILVKDNIETADPVATTAGSLALEHNITGRDAPVVARLRAAGVIILGKANLSEWANIRSSHSESGWSAVGGLVKNPYVLDRSACGSSSGSGAAVAASLAAAALGTETDGSLVCPGSLNGIVSFKPTVGLLSRTHIVPISHSQDTPGPMARTVTGAAMLLTAMAGSDPADPATADADKHKTDYAAALAGASLRGKRLGYIAPDPGAVPTETDLVFARAVAAMKAAGAEIVEIKDFTPPLPVQGTNEQMVLDYELKNDLNAYLAGLPHPVGVKTLADIIAFNRATPRETVLFGQDLFEAAQATKGLSDPAYIKAHADLRASSRATLDKLIGGNRLDALIRSTDDPSFRVDIIKGDNDSSNSSSLPATAGYPHLTVPMGYIHGLPVGLSFIGTAWTEKTLLQLGYAYEQISHARQAPKFIPSLESTPEVERAFAPR
ncbi:MAG TPA: amidase [Rhizomicrobium sp.]|jgi:amidase|nr:amidase [Rhizomicrobium sp.]